jgi:hypothetical protein
MTRKLVVILAILMLGVAVFAAAAPENNNDNDDNDTILKFSTMVGVSGPYVGPTNPIRGVPGGGLPWVISEGKGHLKKNGELKIKVRGLVIPSWDPPFTNPVPTFRAVVSCQSIDANGNPSVVNVSTGDYPASSTGDSKIDATVVLPQPCIAPIIFVTHPAGRWFAATGS